MAEDETLSESGEAQAASEAPAAEPVAEAPAEAPVAEPVAEAEPVNDGQDLTYAKVPETPEEAARIPEILAAFEDSLKLRPYPLEWLVESLQKLRHAKLPWEA